jgi:hypothetical protein
MASQRPKTVFGAAPVGRFTPETLAEFINLLEQYHVKEIDTAYVYVCFFNIRKETIQ